MGKKLLALILLMIILSNSQVNAETVTWDFSGGGSWNIAMHWNPDTIPQPGDDVIINDAHTGIITVDGDAIIKTLTFSGALTITLSTAILSISSAPLKAFITSTSHSGNLGGFDGADTTCQTAAEAAGLLGAYRAWLSTSATDAYCHVQGYNGTKSAKCGQSSLPTAAGPWIRTDGTPFAGTIDKLVSGEIYTPPQYNEYGVLVNPAVVLFTGTNPDGTLNISYSIPRSCDDWNSNNASYQVEIGNSNGTTLLWTSSGSTVCSASGHLICLQVLNGPELPARTFPAGAKRVFVSSSTHNGNLGGLSGADSMCQSLAGSLNPQGTFVAWLSDDTHDAKDRVTSSGPWYRLDGIKVADSKADLTDGIIFTSINYDNTYSYSPMTFVWTGTDSDGTKSTYNCSNWGSTSGDGTAGNTSAVYYWTSANHFSCGTSYKLYCFEQ